MAKLISIILILLFMGCIPTTEYVKTNAPSDGSYEDVLDVSLKRDDFKKTISYRGTYIGGANFGNIMQALAGSAGATAFLRATHSLKNQLTSYQLYITITYTGGWVFYDLAYDEDGEKMDTTNIAKEVIDCEGYALGCSHREDIAVDFEREYLEKYASTGVKIQISSSKNSQETIVDLPSDYIKGFLAAVPISGVPTQTETH